MGTLVLPSNWSRLSAAEQQFVLIELERQARGMRLYAGETSDLVRSAQDGADRGVDPQGDFVQTEEGTGSYLTAGEWGTVYDAHWGDVVGTIWSMEYNDGCPNGSGPWPSNSDCPGVPWGHREFILDDFGVDGAADDPCTWLSPSLRRSFEVGSEVFVGTAAGRKGIAADSAGFCFAKGAPYGTAEIAPAPVFTFSAETPYLPRCEQVSPSECTALPPCPSTSSGEPYFTAYCVNGTGHRGRAEKPAIQTSST
jgi:hypothetical protein